MAGYANAARNVMQDALGVVAVFVSGHTADPGSTGANEISGGSPAYIRKAITWNPASGGTKTASNSPVLDIPAGTTITHLGFWSAVTLGVFYGSSDIVDETYAGQGTYTATTVTLNGPT